MEGLEKPGEDVAEESVEQESLKEEPYVADIHKWYENLDNNDSLKKKIEVRGFRGSAEKLEAELSRSIYEDDYGKMFRAVYKLYNEEGKNVKSSDVSPFAEFVEEEGIWTFDNWANS